MKSMQSAVAKGAEGGTITDVRVRRMIRIVPPRVVRNQFPTTPEMNAQVALHRKTIEDIMHGTDRRMLVIAGPCSIFNKNGTLEFAREFQRIADAVKDNMFLVLRCPPDKPRTVSKAGQWEGLLHEPEVVGEHDSNLGIKKSREIFVELVRMGLPIAIELLDARRTQYFDDLLSFSWTGARAVEYGALRRQACGLSWPVAFKNRTDGALKPALDAIESANHPNYYDGQDYDGDTVIVDGDGNPNACLIMRGAEKPGGRNYDRHHVEAAQRHLRERGLLDFVMVDSAHGNSLDDSGKKDPDRQLAVFESTLSQRLEGNARIGAMIEAYLKKGKQDVKPGTMLASLPYDISPTDPTISIGQFEALVLDAHAQLAAKAQAA